ncbi:class I tRNA ligase family protein, partial [Staphylococcus hominis]|uniref:class I tRNA ligase family protein n=1 Tax=Staphylococcus hominis TaxID=1290 RepID=UPI0011A3443D
IEYHHKPSPSIYLAFHLKHSKPTIHHHPQFIISTTTPSTLPSNLPITLHPHFKYPQYNLNRNKYLIPQPLPQTLSQPLPSH